MLMIESNENKLYKIMEIAAKVICNPMELGCYDDDDYVYGAVNDDLWDAVSKYDKDVSISYGVSKLVIIPSFGDKVIKIPFRGKWYCGEHWDDDIEDYVDSEDYFESFCGANSAYGDDYCAAEEGYYLEAEDAMLAPLFAKTEYVKTINNVAFYVQEKIMGKNHSRISYDSDSYKKASKMNSDSQAWVNDTVWLANVLEYYGEVITEYLLKFLKEQEIRDLHSGNTGYRKNGEPVLIDYSSWND